MIAALHEGLVKTLPAAYLARGFQDFGLLSAGHRTREEDENEQRKKKERESAACTASGGHPETFFSNRKLGSPGAVFFLPLREKLILNDYGD